MNTPDFMRAIRDVQDTVHYQHITVATGSPTKRTCPMCYKQFISGVRFWKEVAPFEETEVCLICWDDASHHLANPKHQHPPRTIA
jgi:hypothetical protein